MEAVISQVKIVHQFSASSTFKTRNGVSCTVFSLPVQKDQPNFQKEGRVLRVKRGKGVSSSVEKILMENEEFDKEEGLIGMRKLINGKCTEGDAGGIVELLECLEREAIMGEDEGREPNDYNRRAQIFDKSSRVFQALKQNSSAV